MTAATPASRALSCHSCRQGQGASARGGSALPSVRPRLLPVMPRPCSACGRDRDKDHPLASPADRGDPKTFVGIGGRVCPVRLSITGRFVHRDRLKDANMMARASATRRQTEPWHDDGRRSALKDRSIL